MVTNKNVCKYSNPLYTLRSEFIYTFVGLIFVRFASAVFATFVGTLSVMLEITLNAITDLSTILL